MDSGIKVSVIQDPTKEHYAVTVSFTNLRQIIERNGKEMVEQVIQKVVDNAAKKYLEDNLAEVMSQMDGRAIANLALARAGKDLAQNFLSGGNRENGQKNN